MKIPKIYQQRLKHIKRDYQNKIDAAKRGNDAEFYLKKMKLLEQQMQQISDKTKLPVKSQADKIIELLKIFEEYAQKYEKDVQFQQSLDQEFKAEVLKIQNMIRQSNLSLSVNDIDELMNEYI